MSTQHTPGPWNVTDERLDRLGNAVWLVYRLSGTGAAPQWMRTPTGRRRKFKSEGAARAAIAKATGSEA